MNCQAIALGDANLRMSQGMSRAGTNSGYFADKVLGKAEGNQMLLKANISHFFKKVANI